MRYWKNGRSRGLRKRSAMQGLLPFFMLNIIVIVLLCFCYGEKLWGTTTTNLKVRFYNRILSLYIPQISLTQEKTSICYEDVLASFLPMLSYSEEIVQYDLQAEETIDYKELAVRENEQMENFLSENSCAREENEKQPETEVSSGTEGNSEKEQVVSEEQNLESQKSEEIPETETTVIASIDKKVTFSIDQMRDFDYLRQNFYIVDASTTSNPDLLNVDSLLSEDLKLDKDAPGPQILIYHTHSLETYIDSTPGDPSQTVVGVGNRLAEILTQQYGWSVLHDTQTYDSVRDYAYSCAAPSLQKTLADHPTIQMVIDLHRDEVRESVHLVTNQNGKSMAKIMFFNGMCSSTTKGVLTNYPNPYLKQNLALSFQMQLTAGEYYPDFTRKIYLKAYRYNMHMCPRTTLIEVGAQNNTFEEALNAMEPLADIINKVLTGEAP